ncbi:Hypothetical protein R9X50_00492300 [Acrodontium crateriforme]|uniref:Uncharacterized protein n=1 Tax=Acrodontium crateriforme TaxID=150365 RepID=A0AAQ3RD05_9PEZI|nr:Hypothetical protein R9X50_00492300 [Acrodontium crateriforme]
MDDDPWFWDVARVQSFFRAGPHQQEYIGNRPGAKLPTEEFLQALEENDVNGACLLSDVEKSTLRDDFNIKSLNVRGTVFHCIEKLREQSAGYATRSQAPSAATSTAAQNLRSPASDAARLMPVSVGQNIRADEYQTVDSQGRKRRKLANLETQAALPQQSIDQGQRSALLSSAPKDDRVDFLPNTALPVDTLFYGPYDFGEEVGMLAPNGDISVDDEDSDEDNFHFTDQQKSRGEAEFVHSRLRHYFQRPETFELQKNGQKVLAVLPYKEGLQRHERSATAFAITAKHDILITRESEAALRGASGILIPQEKSGNHTEGEWDFLIQKYRENSTDSTIVRNESETDSHENTGTDTDSDMIGSDECEVEEVARAVEPSRVAEIIEEVIKRQIIAWKEKDLPRLEAKAWTVWNKMKKSILLQSALIAGSTAHIQELTSRMQNLKTKFMKDPWENEQDLVRTCGAFEPTVQLREEERWRISVWQRRREPPRTPRSKKAPQRYHSAATSLQRGIVTPGFVIHPEDRMSISPGALAPSETEDHYHTPLDKTERIPNHDTDASSEHEDALLIEHNEIIASSTANTPEPLELEPNDGISTATQTRDVQSQESSSDSDELPSSRSTAKLRHSTIAAQLISRTPIAPAQPIDLTLSDSSPPRPSITKRRGRPPGSSNKAACSLNKNAEDATCAEVDSWDFHELSKSRDRERILIKLLREAGTQRRNAIFQGLNKIKPSQVKEQLQAGLQTLKDGNSEVNGLHFEHAEIVLHCAGIFLAWYHVNIGVMKDRTGQESWWDNVLKDSAQHTMFMSRFRALLMKRNSKLFEEQRTAHFVISDSDDEPKTLTPHKKRKKEVQKSEVAMQSRNRALERQERYKKGLAVSNSDSQKLGAMIAGNPSFSGVPINPVKDDDHDFIYVLPSIAHKMKEYQIEGTRFLWRELTSTEEDGSQGCLLAHTMGLGKTMQAISCLVAVVEASQSDNPRIYNQLPPNLRLSDKDRGSRRLRTLILCPASLRDNWSRELQSWAPNALGNIFSTENSRGLLAILENWNEVGGVLLIGYQLFAKAIHRKALSITVNGLATQREHPLHQYGEKIDEILLTNTELVVADEAHNLKNADSAMSKAASSIQTHARIGLTGTPMSNDVQEIYSLVSWIAPGYLGAPEEFRAHFAEPIARGNHADSTVSEIRTGMKRLKVLHSEIEPKVNRADITVLKGSLKPMVEFVVTVSLTEIQDLIYRRYISVLVGESRNSGATQMQIFAWLSFLTLLTNHPRAFRQKMLNRSKETTASTAMNKHGTETPDITVYGEADLDEEGAFGNQDVTKYNISEEEALHLVAGINDDLNPQLSAKILVLLDVLQLSKECGDAVLVFTQSIPTLEYLRDLFTERSIAFGLIHGDINVNKRVEALARFNRKEFDVMLISTKAGGVGLNMQRANRVVIFDFGFNPTHELQAIGRAYRLGQEKPVYVYRFVAGGTFEMNLNNKQLFKTSLAKRVVDRMNPVRNTQRLGAKEWLYEPREVKQEALSAVSGRDPYVLDRILDQEGIGRPGSLYSSNMIRSIRTMETLQAETMDIPLTKEEMEEVEKEREGLSRLRRGLRSTQKNGNGPLTQSHAHSQPFLTQPARASAPFPGGSAVDFARGSQHFQG